MVGRPRETEDAMAASASHGNAAADDGTVLFPVLGGAATDGALDIARAIAVEWHDDLVILVPAAQPMQTPYSLPERENEHHRAEKYAFRASTGTAASVRGVVRVGHSVEHIVTSAVDRYDTTGVVLEDESAGSTVLESIRGPTAADLATAVDCDSVLVSGTDRLDEVASILVPVAGGPHSRLAADVAEALARQFDAWLELLHVVGEDAPEERRREGEDVLETARDRLDGIERVDTWLLEAGDVVDEIIEQSSYYDVTVLGAPRKSRLREFVFGSTAGQVREAATNTVVTVRRNDLEDESWIARALGW